MNFSSIKKELDSIEFLEKNVGNLSSEEFEITFLSSLGAAVIQIQIAEYAMLGAISHLKETILIKDKRFKDLNPQRFLSNDPIDKVYRKQTLGVIIEFLKSNVKIFNLDDLEIYLSNRNDLVHNYWRIYLSHNRFNDRTEKVKALKFALSVYQDSLKWSSIFKGFIYEMVLQVRTKEQSIESFSNLKKHHDTFLKSIAMISKKE